MEQVHHLTPKENDHSASDRKHREGWRSAASTITILILAPLVAIFLTTFVFQSYEVDGPSMEPTLQDGNRLIVWKVPRTLARITGNGYIPGRGEVIVFSQSSEAGSSANKQLIKRVIGLPGERIVVRNGNITIYNKDKPDGFHPNIDGYHPGNTDGNIDLTIPKGKVFVVGDNRANSLDSRVFGAISTDEIVGNLAIRIFPFNEFKLF